MKSAVRYISFVTATLICLQTISLLVIESEFNLNKSYIASVLCENRDKPMTHCDGKCFLKKELNHQQEKESSQKLTNTFVSLQFFCEEISDFHFFSPDQKVFLPEIPFLLSTGFGLTNEQPPTC